MKNATYFGIIGALLLIGSCFISWAYYPDLRENFTGFYSSGNTYGKPGKAFIFLAAISIILFLTPKLWAKRANQFVAVLIFAYALKTYFIFAGCYLGFCPTVKAGLFGVIGSSLVVLISSLLSKAKVSPEN